MKYLNFVFSKLVFGQKYIKNLMVDAHSAFLIYPIKSF